MPLKLKLFTNLKQIISDMSDKQIRINHHSLAIGYTLVITHMKNSYIFLTLNLRNIASHYPNSSREKEQMF